MEKENKKLRDAAKKKQNEIVRVSERERREQRRRERGREGVGLMETAKNESVCVCTFAFPGTSSICKKER